MKKRPMTSGEMISTLCYIGVAVWTLGAAQDAPPLKAAVLVLCAVACLIGAARRPLARLLDHWQNL